MSIVNSFSHGKKHDSSRISRSNKSRTLKNLDKQKEKYPKITEEIIKKSDIILQILDIRFINETRNYEIEKMIKDENKKIIYVINKSDLIEEKKVKEIKELNELNPKVFVSCLNRDGIKELRNRIKIVSSQVKVFSDKRKRKITVGLIGYPNTGKSSILNLLIGKRISGVASEAGFTKGIKKAKLTENILLFDTPGIIPNKQYSSSENSLLSQHTKIGARAYNQVKNPDLAVSQIMKEFPKVFDEYYLVCSKNNPETLIELVGRKKNFLKKGNLVDEDKTARLILKEWQEGKIKKD